MLHLNADESSFLRALVSFGMFLLTCLMSNALGACLKFNVKIVGVLNLASSVEYGLLVKRGFSRANLYDSLLDFKACI